MPTLEQARGWYPVHDPTHGFTHIQRVYSLAGFISRQEGARWEIVRAAVLLHDAHGGEEDRGGHHQSAARFAGKVLRQEGWSQEDISAVQHCIRAHRFRDQSLSPQSLEARVLFDADKLDAMGAVGVVRAVAYAVQNGQPIFYEPSEKFLQTGKKEDGEPHTPYHEYMFKLRHLADKMQTETGRQLAASRHRAMVRFFSRFAQETWGRGCGEGDEEGQETAGASSNPGEGGRNGDPGGRD